MICLILRSQHLCFASPHICPLRARPDGAGELPPKARYSLLLVILPGSGRHMALCMGFSRGPPFAVLRSVYQTASRPDEAV